MMSSPVICSWRRSVARDPRAVNSAIDEDPRLAKSGIAPHFSHIPPFYWLFYPGGKPLAKYGGIRAQPMGWQLGRIFTAAVLLLLAAAGPGAGTARTGIDR